MTRMLKCKKRKFDYSAKTGKRYKASVPKQMSILEHNKRLVPQELEKLKEEYSGKDVDVVNLLNPHPDGLLVDYEKKEITAIEISKFDQQGKKRRSYQNCPEWRKRHVLIIRTQETKLGTLTYLWRRLSQRGI